MERKTYYMILGVSSTETAEGIRTAFRDLAKRLHPDVSGHQSTGAFQEVAEAYRVLSDPQLRRDYNDGLRRPAEGGLPVPPPPPGPSVRETITILGQQENIPKSEHLEGLDFEVLLTRDESTRGCTVPVRVPVFSRCPECGGSGRSWIFPCAVCQQQGMSEREQTVSFRIPPMPRSGSIFEIPLRGLGIHDFHLRLHVFVEASP